MQTSNFPIVRPRNLKAMYGMQVSSHLRRLTNGYIHWCPGCKESHAIFDNWTFDGNLVSPTFNPSVRITGMCFDEQAGEWPRDAAGKPIPFVCHYHLHAGVLKYCEDCTHELKSKEVPLPELPDWLRD